MNQYSKRPESFNENIFENIDTEEKAYWLGFLYADGAIGSSDNRIELSLAEKDLEHIKKFKNFIGLDNKISYREKTKAYRFQYKNKKTKNDLINKGCYPQKSLILVYPNYSQVPKNLSRHFIRGYFDGDGYFSNTEKTFSIGFIGTENFIKGVLNELPDDFKKTNGIFNVHRENGAKKYIISEEKSVKSFLNFIYKDSTIYLNRKYDLYLEYINIGRKNKMPHIKEI